MRALIRTADIRSLLREQDLFREQAFIAGHWIGAETTIPVDNPATGAIIGSVPELGAAEARRAVETAKAAFPAWRAVTARERSLVLRRWADLMHAHADDLALILTAEQGKPLSEAKSEVAYAASFLEWFAEEARRIHYGEADNRGIRGEATPEERAALNDEGIEVMSIPVPRALKGPVQ